MAIPAVGAGILTGIFALVPGGIRFYTVVVRRRRCGVFGTLALMVVPFCAVLYTLWCVWTCNPGVFIPYASGVVISFVTSCIIGLVVAYCTLDERR